MQIMTQAGVLKINKKIQIIFGNHECCVVQNKKEWHLLVFNDTATLVSMEETYYSFEKAPSCCTIYAGEDLKEYMAHSRYCQLA